MNTVEPDELAGLAKRYLDLADADLLRAFELALADLVVAERHISWGLVRGRVDPVAVPEIFLRNYEATDPA
ncbi:hypothetical protein NDN16_18345 [Aureimonas altamirensis]|uniref:hypothetical protein n=1 Tax=Aureimonas altamirensis TaxID=370622 RepID=UPI002036D678|nr:hypothetical protein [Aureimonas altamirensis]MCM2505630.1 hypothetical protein [Aureimonas altamirensis]